MWMKGRWKQRGFPIGIGDETADNPGTAKPGSTKKRLSEKTSFLSQSQINSN
jgi:hypothetical protein